MLALEKIKDYSNLKISALIGQQVQGNGQEPLQAHYPCLDPLFLHFSIVK